jgi:hypothetical protein
MRGHDQNVMSEGTVRQWRRMFTDGRTNVKDEERSCRSSVVSDGLVQTVDQKICERRRFTNSELPCEFLQTSRTVLSESIVVRLGYRKFYARSFQKVLTGGHKTQRMVSA